MVTPNDDPTMDQDLSPSDNPTNDESLRNEEESNVGKKTAEARINDLLSKNKQLEEKLQAIEEKVSAPPPPPATPTSVELKSNPQLEQASKLIREMGFVSKDELQAEIQTLKDISTLNGEHARLERGYDGGDGRPQYVRSEVEKYMREHGVYDPEIAYKALHETELIDWRLKQVDGKKKDQPYVERPGASAHGRGDNTITRETIAEWMKTPEGRAKYEKNRDKILTLMAQGQL